jgi:hypothetical protein
MNRLQAVTGVAAIVLLAACAPAVAHTVAHTAAGGTAAGGTAAGGIAAGGTVSGKLEIDGGPISPDGRQPGKRPWPGTVRFTRTHHHPITVHVGDSGTFSVHLPPGTYATCSRPAGMPGPCSDARKVAVTAGHTTEIAFTFFVP